jgi:hypothetical protein
MRKLFHYALSALFVVSVMVACDKKQSELTMDSITGSATITGTVEYDEGTYRNANGNIVSEHKIPATGQKVIATIANSNYGNADGHTTFTAVVDSLGNYKLTVPVAASQEVDVQISVAPFKASNSTLNENNEIQSDSSVVYTLAVPEFVTVKDGEESFVDMVLTADRDAQSKGIVSGSVTYDQGAHKQTDGSIISQYIVPAAGKSVIFTNTDDGQYYTAVVGNDGKYEIALPIGNYTASVVPFKASKFEIAVTGNEVVEFPNSLFDVAYPDYIDVNAGMTSEADFTPTATIEQKMKFDKQVEIKGVAYIEKAQLNNDSTVLGLAWVPSNKTQVAVVVEFTDPETQEQVTMIYRTTPDVDGNYSFSAMLPTDFSTMGTNAFVEYEIAEKTTTAFPFRRSGETKWNTQTVDVITIPTQSYPTAILETNTLVPLILSDLNIDIYPVDINTVHGFENNSEYEYHDPLNWY